MQLQLHSFVTPSLDEAEWLASFTCRLRPEKERLVFVGYETGWTPESVWTT